MSAESETNSLTMKLLALAHHCEGPKASEIQAIIARLPAAAYIEREEANMEINRLQEENTQLKQKLAQEVFGSRTKPPPPPQCREDVRPTRFDVRTPSSTIKTEACNGDHDRRSDASTSTTSSARDPRLTPPDPRELFPDGTSFGQHSAKRRRDNSPPLPPHHRKRPECVGCFQIKGACDGKAVCSCCQARKYGCEYRECWDGNSCSDRNCTRLHPDQWEKYSDEPPRKVRRWATS